MQIQNSTHSLPIQSAQQAQPGLKNNVLKIFTRVMEEAKTVLYHTALTGLKIVAVPFEVAVLAVACAITALAAVVSLPFKLHPKGPEDLKPVHTMVSVVVDIVEIIEITLRLGLHPKLEMLQLVDDKPDSPKFVKVLPEKEAKKTPVLLLPGYLDSPLSFRDTARRLANRLNCPVYIAKYCSYFQSIEKDAKDAARLTDRIARDEGRNDLIVIGHSKGGLVGARLIQTNKNRVRVFMRWITIATPHKGTPIARLGIGKCAEEMRPGSRLLRKINRKSILDTIPQQHIGSDVDLVVPSPSARRKRSTNNYLCRVPRGHLGVRATREVEELIVKTCQGD